MSYFTTLITAVSILGASAWGAECGLDRSGTIFTKKNGEKVYLLFGAHKETVGKSLMDFLEQFDKDHDKAALSKSIQDYLKDNSVGLKSHQAQLRKVEDLAQKGQIQWIGDETVPQVFKAEDLEHLKSAARGLKYRMQMAGVANDKIESHLLLAFGPGVYSFAEEAPWTMKVSLVSVDSDEIKDRQLKALEDGMNTKVPGGDPEIIKTVFLEMINKVSEGEEISPEIIQKVSESFPPATREIYRGMLNRVYIYKLGLDQRDQYIANRLLSEAGNGVLLMGDAHRKGVVSFLKASCRAPTKAAPSPVESGK